MSTTHTELETRYGPATNYINLDVIRAAFEPRELAWLIDDLEIGYIWVMERSKAPPIAHVVVLVNGQPDTPGVDDAIENTIVLRQSDAQSAKLGRILNRGVLAGLSKVHKAQLWRYVQGTWSPIEIDEADLTAYAPDWWDLGHDDLLRAAGLEIIDSEVCVIGESEDPDIDALYVVRAPATHRMGWVKVSTGYGGFLTVADALYYGDDRDLLVSLAHSILSAIVWTDIPVKDSLRAALNDPMSAKTIPYWGRLDNIAINTYLERDPHEQR